MPMADPLEYLKLGLTLGWALRGNYASSQLLGGGGGTIGSRRGEEARRPYTTAPRSTRPTTFRQVTDAAGTVASVTGSAIRGTAAAIGTASGFIANIIPSKPTGERQVTLHTRPVRRPASPTVVTPPKPSVRLHGRTRSAPTPPPRTIQPVRFGYNFQDWEL